jgi:hypothetical protein
MEQVLNIYFDFKVNKADEFLAVMQAAYGITEGIMRT